MKLFIVLALLGCVYGAPKAQRGVPMLDGRIIGGDTVTIEEYNYQVSLLWWGSHICGGSLITANAVVTAAHCTNSNAASQFGVRAGSSIRNSGGSALSVSVLSQHENYDRLTVDNDISVLILSKGFDLSASIGLIALPTLNQAIPSGVDSTVTGWGTTSEGGSPANQLQRVFVPIVSQEDCRAAYSQSLITDNMICAGASGRDACQGDSGGPLVINGQLIGIVSWGLGCARPGYPGVYASVPALREFIRINTGL